MTPTHLKYRTQHTHSTALTHADKWKRLQTWKHWRKSGIKGETLIRRTHMDLRAVRKMAADIGFDLEGLA